jgi:toxin ParE1/3/4
MSELFWSEDAETDLDDITAYIARSNAGAAVRVRGEIERRIEVLADHPEAGRSGRVARTREMFLAGTPYIAVYLIRDDDVTVLRVLHGAQRWPPLVG